MQKCPVCAQSVSGPVCSQCGFDDSQNHAKYATFLPLSENAKALSAYQADWTQQCAQLLSCDSCGGRKFEINLVRKQICCTDCGSALHKSQLKALHRFPGLQASQPAVQAFPAPTAGAVPAQGKALFQIDGSKLVKYRGQEEEPLFPQGITKIGDAAFKDNPYIRSIQIPASVQEIADSAFSGCKNLVYVDLPSGVKRIEYSAFQGCTSLREVSLPESLQHIGSYAFDGCESLMRINIPYGIYKIEFGTFRNCSSLKKIIIPGNIMFISANAFENCSQLETLIIRDGVSSIRALAFAGCTALREIHIPDTVYWLPTNTFDGCKLSMGSFRTSADWMDAHGNMLKTVIDWSQNSERKS